MTRKLNIWGIKLSINSLLEIIEAFDTFLKKGGKGFQMSPADANVIYLALENEELRESLLASDIVSVDSFFVLVSS